MDSFKGDAVQSSFGERRGHRLAPLNTNINQPKAAQPKVQSSRLQRPRPTDYPSTNGSEGPVPLTPVKRQSSKSSLRSLFSRDKTTRAAAVPDSKLSEIEETQPPATAPTPVTTTQTITVPSTPVSSGLLSPGTAASTPGLATPTTPRARATLKTSRTPPRESKPPPKPPKPAKDQCGWKPPPLFQAYPQSTKSECLMAPALSADSILRLHASMRKSGENGRTGGSTKDETADLARKKKEQKERKHLRTLSGTINKVEWTRKIYVLATTGFILQYAGEGKNDRLPEKMLQLGPESVAFASDAIPGKHWVLQISRDPTADPALPEPKSKFSRFGFHRSSARRLVQSFLLVFENPDSMISWLTAVREEIEARGGPKFTAEKHSDEGPEPRLRSKSSVRQMVKKDPHRVSSLFLQPQNAGNSNEDDRQSVGGLTLQSRQSSYVSLSRRSMLDSRAGSTSTGWTDGVPTTPTDVRASSFTSAYVPNSPPVPNGSLGNTDPGTPGADSSHTRSPPTSSHGKRQSVLPPSRPQVPLATRIEASQAGSRPISPDHLTRSASPPAPNFSVPSFSKKFVSRPSLPPTSHPQQSVDGILRNGETPDVSFSSISSPPLSPTYSATSSRHTDSSEPPSIPFDGTGRRTLRAFNSEDALSRLARPGNGASPAGARVSLVPQASAQSLRQSESLSRSLSITGQNGLGIQLNGSSMAQTIPQATPSPPLGPKSRPRTSNAEADGQAPRSVSHRKSMPGLTHGPPAAPPPNCPLPQIPSPSSSTNDINDVSLSPSVREQFQERRKSNMLLGLSSNGGSKPVARHSRILE